MTNAEHLIENAISDTEKGYKYEHFANEWYNKQMAKDCNIDLKYIWEMAQYVVWCCKPEWELEKQEQMEEIYGYKLDI